MQFLDRVYHFIIFFSRPRTSPSSQGMNINVDLAKDILCKNILIYGYCKYENKGCVFNHNKALKPDAAGATAAATGGGPAAGTEKKRYNLNTPSFQPLNTPAAPSPKVREAVAFDALDSGVTTKKFNANTASFTPTFVPTAPNPGSPGPLQPPQRPPQQHLQLLPPGLGGPSGANSAAGSGPMASASLLMPQMQPQDMQPPTVGTPNPYSAPTSSLDMYFQQLTARSYPLQYHLYAPAPPPRLTFPLPPHETNAQQLFIDNEIRESLTKKNEATLRAFPSRSHLPEHINVYHSLVPIETSLHQASKVFGVPTTPFKVFSNVDGNPYLLAKIDNLDLIRIQNDGPFATIKQWKAVALANVVKLRDAFTSMAFGGKHASLVMVYDYYPNSNTLQEQHIVRKLGGKLEPLNEQVLTGYIIQITCALAALHAQGLAARSSLDITKILVTSKNRVRLAWGGVSDVLEHERDEQAASSSSHDDYLLVLQQQDIKRFGKLILDLSLLCVVPAARDQSVHCLSGVFSPGFVRIVSALLDSDGTINDFYQTHLSTALIGFASDTQDGQDYAELQLAGELENARLFRLLTKINFIMDMGDALENGPHYIIKLFREFVFNEVSEVGKPTLNLSRVLTCLNKLDAGIEEKMLLISKDEKSCIVISYKEVKDLIGSAFRDMTRM